MERNNVGPEIDPGAPGVPAGGGGRHAPGSSSPAATLAAAIVSGRVLDRIRRALREPSRPPERDPARRPAMDTIDDWILFGPRLRSSG